MFWPIHCHPDFGYLAPTSRFWKLARVGAAAGAVGLFVGSVGVIGFSQRPEFERLREDFSEALRSSQPYTYALSTSTDSEPAPSDASCASLTRPDLDERCQPETQRAPPVVQERFPETRRRAAGSASPGRRMQSPPVPAAAIPPETALLAAPPAATSASAARPGVTPPVRSVATENPKGVSSLAAGTIDAPTAAVTPVLSEAAPQKTRRRSDHRARLDSQSLNARVERRGVVGASGQIGYDREVGRNDTGRLGSDPVTQPRFERRGFFWCMQGQGKSC
jgi:hypothetical protein